MRFLHRAPASLVALSALLLVAASCDMPGRLAGPDNAIRTAGPVRSATVPAKGTATSLDLASWNIEWFGDPANGPTNEALQLSNSRDVISGADMDIWAFGEIVSNTQFNDMESQLTGYTGFLANETLVVDGPAYYSDFSNTEQKVGILYKSSVATLLGAKIILKANDYDFAGRPPMEVKLRVTLNGSTEDIVVIALHMKCCTDDASYTRRKNASTALKSYLDTTYPTQKVFVIGDWNDDVDTSIMIGSPSPYKNFVDATTTYRFPTKALSDAGVASTVNYSDMIDHHLATNEGDATYIANSAEVYRVDQYIASYGTTTSDHYPVLTRYTFSGGGPPPPNAAPTANFTSSCTDLSCSFTDASTDSDGSIASWSWNFGDATTATVQNPSHSYAAAGTYTVTLTVTDNAGATASKSQAVTVTAPSGITLSARGYKVKGLPKADLTWSGATATNMDVYRNNVIVTTTANDGAHTDNLPKGSIGTFTYKVCAAGTTTCSGNASVVF